MTLHSAHVWAITCSMMHTSPWHRGGASNCHNVRGCAARFLQQPHLLHSPARLLVPLLLRRGGQVNLPAAPCAGVQDKQRDGDGTQ